MEQIEKNVVQKKSISMISLIFIIILVYSASLLPSIVILSMLPLKRDSIVGKVIEVLYYPHFFVVERNETYYRYFLWCEEVMGSYDPLSDRLSFLHCLENWMKNRLE